MARMTRALGLIAALVLLAGCGASPTETARLANEAAPAATTSAVIVAVGDIACPPGKPVTRTTCRQAATARAAAAIKPARVIPLGDLQYETGNYNAYLGSYAKSWGRFRPITWPVIGNHEYRTPGARGTYRYLAGLITAPGWYRKEINGWQVYLLNSNCDQVDCAAERNWLRNQLITHPSRCALIAMHHPRFSSGFEHGSNPSMRGFWRIARSYGVDVALAGHDHDYERFALLDEDGRRDPKGIHGFVVGTGGKSLYAKGTTAPGSQRFISRFGVLKMTLRTYGYSWQFRDTALNVRDSGTSACR